jgi:hypothetical protein
VCIFNELLYCVDYAIVNDVDKDSILCIVDALLDFYRRGFQCDVTADRQAHKYIEDSGLSSDELETKHDKLRTLIIRRRTIMLETNKVLTLAEIDRQLKYMEAKPIAEALDISVQTLYRIKRGKE